MYTSRSFMVFCIMFNSLSHFEFIFVDVVRVCSSFIDLHVAVSRFPSTTCWKACLFPILYSFLLCWRLIDHRCLGLFLGSLFCSIGLSVLVTVPHCLDYCSFVILSEILESYASCFVFFPSGLLWQFWVFYGFI